MKSLELPFSWKVLVENNALDILENKLKVFLILSKKKHAEKNTN